MIHVSARKVSLILFSFLLLTVSALFGQEKSQAVRQRPAPSFVLPSWDGKVLKSATLKGQVVVLEFFQTGCPDCQQTAPELEKLYKRYKEQGFTIVGISHDKEGAKAVEPFVKKHGITYPVLIGDHSIAMSYLGITPEKPSFRIPYVIVIDRKGNIVGEYEEGTHKEAVDVKLLEERIKKLL